MGKLNEAAEAFDAALAMEPGRRTVLHGRARVALERGEPSAADLYKRALAATPGDLNLCLGLAEALELEGDATAIDGLAAAVASAPHWAEGQAVLARMRWEAGEGSKFTRDIVRALAARPADRDLWVTFASSLAAANLSSEAADVAARAQKSVGGDLALRLLEASQASKAGDLKRSDRLFASLPANLPGRKLHEIVHRIRQGDHGLAMQLADAARAEEAWAVGVWALTGLLWRAMDDSRSAWLHEQPGLIARQHLELSRTGIDEIATHLRGLHRTRAHPIGQSLRGGTQTRGRLFERSEEPVKRLRAAILSAVRRYWEALPPHDPDHPLPRWRKGTPRFDGSWSVRLTDGGFHVAHVHPNGILSSACYLALPTPTDARDGWLEIGRPPPDLGLDLGPIEAVEPQPGLLALFPSTLYPGTRPFSAGERLTAAFDVVVA